MKEVIDFSLDTENGEKNYALAQWYEAQGHTAPAHTYYLRAAERTEDDILAYKALLRASFCYRCQGSRDATEKVLLENALNLIPERPEAYYFLSFLYERKQDWQNCYNYAGLGLKFHSPEIQDIGIPEYPGEYALIFEKSVASWWWGKGEESRKLLWKLSDEYWNIMNDDFKIKVKNNISQLCPEINPKNSIFYSQKEHKNLRYEFNGSENISTNHSTAFQDIFVLSLLDGKRNGKFLEIGENRPFEGNNTALLESNFDWDGISIHSNKEISNSYKELRPNTKTICKNFLEINYTEILQENNFPNVIDYLQVQVIPSKGTYECLLNIPFDSYKFATITCQHNDYIDLNGQCKKKIRKFLKEKGYVLVVNDISVDGISSFEDWWAHPNLIEENILDIMKSNSENKVIKIDEYFYQNKRSNQIVIENSMISSFVPIFNKPKGTSWIVDNFYQDPDEVRKFALNVDYFEGGIGRGFIGRRTTEQYLFPGLKERFEEIMGKKITGWEGYDMNGRFQVAWSGEPLVWHCDNQQWGGMLYLTPEAPYQCGTTLYAHKKTRARTYYDKGWDAAWVDIPGDCHLDGTPFEPVDVLGNVYNRLVIFDASCIHSASEYFGTVMENARLWQMFFFDT